MKQENKETLIKYAICFGVEALIVFLVIWSNGFFTGSAAVNLQITADAFFVAGLLMLLFAGMMYISSEGALLGVGFALRHAFLTLIPMGRLKHEKNIDYRARKHAYAK